MTENKTDEELDPIITLLADPALTRQIFLTMQESRAVFQLKTGMDNALKSIKRGVAEIVIIAADIKPLYLIYPIAIECEEYNVTYIFVKSKKALGRACGSTRFVSVCTIIGNELSQVKNDVYLLQDRIAAFAFEQKLKDKTE